MKNVVAWTVLLVLLAVGAGVGQGAYQEIPYHFDRPELAGQQGSYAVAVALSGGGARAYVNVGVLKALEEAGVPIDLVTGSSMGALIAIFYGSGMPMSQMERLLLDVDFASLFQLNVPFHRSLLSGERFHYAVEALVPVKRLEEFPIPAALLSFDLNNGVKYVHTQGAVSEAIQAPYAIPGIFPGVYLDEFFLLDGGIQELVPSLLARELGAQVVIATTAFDELPYTMYNNPLRAWMRTINLIKEHYSLSIVEEYSDVIIAMDVGAHSLMDFQRAAMFIDWGYRSAQEMLPDILAVLEAEGIVLEHRTRDELPAVDQAIDDLRRDRLFYPELILRPLGYFGGDYSILAPRYFSGNQGGLQYGFGVEDGFWSVDVLAAGFVDRAEVALRRKQLTAWWDGAAAAGYDDGRLWGTLGVQYSGIDGYAEGGWSWFGSDGGAPYLRGGITRPGWAVEGYLRGTAVETAAGFAAAAVELPLPGPLSLRAQAAAVLGQPLNVPRMYRGVEPEAVPALQWGTELVYRYETEYTVEIAQIIQFTGLEVYAFLDGSSGELGPALGAGLRLPLRLVGLKPSVFDFYAAYDLRQQAPSFRLAVDLAF